MIKVYRFHGPGQDTEAASPFLLRKRKLKRCKEFYFLAADKSTITDINGTRPIEEFKSLSCNSAVTATKIEADLVALANPGLRPPYAIEDMFPWLPRRSFVPDSVVGFNSLKQILKKYGHHFVSASDYCDMAWNRVCNSLRRKTTLDQRFQLAWHHPIQDVFILEENRPDRSVIALDVNSMYSSCMQHAIPHPAYIRRIDLYRNYKAGELLSSGLYRCHLSQPSTDFIRKYNPFTVYFYGRRLRASLNEKIQVDLNEFEVYYLSQHFAEIYIEDAVVSDKVVPHPLAKESKRAFLRRNNYRFQGNKPLADREKYLATLLSSCSSRPRTIEESFLNRKDAMAMLSTTLGIMPPSDEPEAATDVWLNRIKNTSFSVGLGGFRVVIPDQNDHATCFMLTQRVVAHGRIHLLKLMERVLKLNPDVDICYVNIDSVHLSVLTSELDNILELLQAEASEEMGAFKIEAVTAHGLWLEPGRYWLYSKNVEKFRNRSIGSAEKPFQECSFHVTSREIDNLHIPIRKLIRMESSMSHLRTLYKCHNGLVRQRLIELNSGSSFSKTLDLLESSRRSDTTLRLEAFQRLKHQIGQACFAASEQAWDPS